mgnify:CR=1 FL=1
MTASDLLRDILRTARVTGLSREHAEAIEEALARLVCEACERARVAGMADPSLLPQSLSHLINARDRTRAVASSLEALATRSDIPADVARVIAAAAGELRAIGGPIDPNAPAGG